MADKCGELVAGYSSAAQTQRTIDGGVGPSGEGRISPAMSTYLDLLRFVAAILVVLFHASYMRFSTTPLPLSGLGIEAVAIFFVISGFVIAWTAENRDRNMRLYFVNRLSRLWSVALPAIVLTFALDYAGHALDPVFYKARWYPTDEPFRRMVWSALFLNEFWGTQVQLFTNTPYWSLAYEFWYYVLFAIAYFLRGWQRYALVLIVAVLIGPKILLLLPIWFLGCALWLYRDRMRVPRFASWILFTGSIAAICAFDAFDARQSLDGLTASWLGDTATTQLAYSRHFLSSYLIGALVFVNLIGFKGIEGDLAPLLYRVRRPIRALAGFTFTTYLLHFPLLHFWAAALGHDRLEPTDIVAVLACTAVSVYLVGRLTEQKKHLARALVWRCIDDPNGGSRTTRSNPT